MDALSVPFARYLFNSLFVTIATVTAGVILSSLAAYPLAKYPRMPGGKLFFSIVISTLMFAPEVTQIPRYLVVDRLGLIDTYAGLIIPVIAGSYGLFLMKQFMETIPGSLIDSSRIDGASELQVFRSIIVPLSLPIIATLFLLTFQFHWGNFLWQLIVTNKESLYTVPVGLAMFRDAHEELVTLKMAGAAISIIPIGALFFFTQRLFIEGMTKGAVKG